MDTVLYITGGIALLALAWLLISLAQTLKVAQKIMVETVADVHEFTRDWHDVTIQLSPILQNVKHFSDRANTIVDGVQSQMVSIHSAVDDTLDVVRGTIDDVERLKNEVVDIVETPLRAVRVGSATTAGAILKGISFVTRLLGDRTNGKHRE